jgi:hypothetical protein
MTQEQVLRYLELANRESYIILHSGDSWKPEWADELEAIKKELDSLREIIAAEHQTRKQA